MTRRQGIIAALVAPWAATVQAADEPTTGTIGIAAAPARNGMVMWWSGDGLHVEADGREVHISVKEIMDALEGKPEPVHAIAQ